MQLALRNLSRAGSRLDLQEAEAKLEVVFLEEEVYWRQRSRELWLRWGDRNTRWFHNHASYRKKRNTIRGLEDGGDS